MCRDLCLNLPFKNEEDHLCLSLPLQNEEDQLPERGDFPEVNLLLCQPGCAEFLLYRY
jgi:hypothetical protein